MGEPPQDPLQSLRAFAERRPAIERCDLCGAALPERHGHVFRSVRRELKCCCPACGLLFRVGEDAAWKAVRPRVERLEISIDDAAWDALQLPIQLAFFQRSGVDGEVRAFFPSAAGATESLLPAGAWERVEAAHPALEAMADDVEALLVNRTGGLREHYLVSIDECFALVGLIRARWRGFTGGAEAWEGIREFFDRLRGRSHA
ncbi:MAG TPA: DUF5947 family protein [Myxococcaceae bacterium]|nr:DUF5947 family protein [Myxococcaceae bacterium]